MVQSTGVWNIWNGKMYPKIIMCGHFVVGSVFILNVQLIGEVNEERKREEGEEFKIHVENVRLWKNKC